MWIDFTFINCLYKVATPGERQQLVFPVFKTTSCFLKPSFFLTSVQMFYHRQEGNVVVVVCLSVSNFVQRLLNGFAWDFQGRLVNEQMIKFWLRSVSRFRSATLVSRALTEVCTVQMLLVKNRLHKHHSLQNVFRVCRSVAKHIRDDVTIHWRLRDFKPRLDTYQISSTHKVSCCWSRPWTASIFPSLDTLLLSCYSATWWDWFC